MPSYFLTIIVPVFDEIENLPRFYEEMNKFLTVAPVATKVLFVNDGSTDGSLRLIKDICATDNRYFYLSFNQNQGLSAAIKAGIDYCNTPLLGYIDADLQTLPEDFYQFLKYFPEYQMVNGIRKKRSDSIVKTISSKVANSFRRVMINDKITDTCCPLKIIDTATAKKLPFFTGMHRFIPALVQLQGGIVKQVEIKHYRRFAGKAKYHLFNRLVSPFFDTLAFVWMRKRNIQYQVVETNISE